MAYYARVNSENVVVYVTPVSDTMITEENGVENEDQALNHLYTTIPDSVGDRWIRTSYTGEFRKRYAGMGYIWNEELDAFIQPRPYASWVLNTQSCEWDPPVPIPQTSEDGVQYTWDEENVNWKPVY